MKTLRFILGDQLSRSISSLSDLDPSTDIVLLVEVHQEATYVRHHKQKIALVLSAMRHFAEALRSDGIQVDYVQLTDEENTGSFSGELKRAVERHKPGRVVVTEPGEWRVRQTMEEWEDGCGRPVDIREDDRFLCSIDEFREWAEGRKRLTMEYFYREMRKRTGWLMTDDGEPEGGDWNYDKANRKRIPKDLEIPRRDRFTPDEITGQVIELVNDRFSDHFGDLDDFGWAVTREDAVLALDHFVKDCLPRFGDYQDAMKTDEDLLFHAILSPYINIGLLSPEVVCLAAIDAYTSGSAPLNAVEGFVRQILGWREFIRGIYWTQMPDYAESNFLEANRPLPDLYWTGETDMVCMRQTIEATRRNAYAHHIQRLMVTGNFALLAGIDPEEVEAWYLAVYADAFEWVELPNTHGMALHADGGLLGSKPYAASGAYINRMSDYCKSCAYKVSEKEGDDACPFNYLYWNFIIRNEDKLSDNPRMALIYRNLEKLSEDQREAYQAQSKQFLKSIAT